MLKGVVQDERRETERTETMKAWIARDWSGVVYLYPLKPQKEQLRWESVAQAYQFIDDRLLPPDINPQWGDKEPIEVEIKIEKK